MLRYRSVDWTCPVCQQSNKEIMQKHEEMLNVRAVEKFQASQQPISNHASPEPGIKHLPPPVMQNPSVGLPPQRQNQLQPHATSELLDASIASTASSSASSRPGTIMITEHPTEALAPSPLVRALLTPPPDYLAPLRLLHHHLCKLLCPMQYHQLLPPRPDSVLWLDTLIFVILSLLTVMLLSKLSRSWTRIVYAMFQTVERISGIDMSWISDKLSPNRLPNHPYGQYWTSGGMATGAGMHGDRTRLRNMDTAMRARDIIKRFGRAPQADGGEALHVPTHDQPQVNRGA